MKSVLIIEDDQTIARALAIRMREAGYQANMAYDAPSGLSTAKKMLPDIVLMDINMPGGDGFMVAERIMMVVPTITPIIFITASKEPGLQQKAMELGAAAFFEKPYESQQLINAIQNVLGE